jgi:hypothetical protein
MDIENEPLREKENISLELNFLRNKLMVIESSFDSKYTEIEKRISSDERNEIKITKLFEKQSQIIKFNVSGKLFTCNLLMFLNTEYDNYLTNLCDNLTRKLKLSELETIVIDRNPKHFKTIVDIFRRRLDQLEGVLPSVKQGRINFPLNQNKIKNIQLFRNDLEFYFTPDTFEKLVNDFKITYQEDGVTKTIKGNIYNPNSCLEQFEITNKYPSEFLEPYITSKIEDLLSLDNIMQGIFCDYDSSIIFNFSELVKLKKIDIRPFWGDLNYWYPGDGAGSHVLYSKDKTSWEFLTMIPDDYGFDMNLLHTMDFVEIECQYIKLEAKQYPLSISYIRFG